MHIHLPLSWDYLLFVWAPSSLRQVTGSCIHEGEACPDKTWIRDYQSARSRNGSPDKKRSKACRSVTDHFCEGGGNQGGTFSPCPPQHQHLKLHGIILGIWVFIAAQQHADCFRDVFWRGPTKGHVTYCPPDGLCAFHDMNLVVFGTVWLPIKIKIK